MSLLSVQPGYNPYQYQDQPIPGRYTLGQANIERAGANGVLGGVVTGATFFPAITYLLTKNPVLGAVASFVGGLLGGVGGGSLAKSNALKNEVKYDGKVDGGAYNLGRLPYGVFGLEGFGFGFAPPIGSLGSPPYGLGGLGTPPYAIF